MVGVEARLHGEGVEAACEVPCEASRGAEEERRCSQAGGDAEEAKVHQAVEDPGKAAGSARMEMVDAGQDWVDRVAYRSDHWAAHPSCQEVEGHCGREHPCQRVGRDGTWAAAKVDGGGANRQGVVQGQHAMDTTVQVDSL